MNGTPPKTPLEDRLKHKIGLDDKALLTRSAISGYQVRKMIELLSFARRHSPHYARLLGDLPEAPLLDLEDIACIPLTTATDIRKNPLGFLCVSQDEVARVVTLRTSGTTAQPKRFFFTETDLELTIDFFHHGLSTLVRPGQRVLVLMPGDSPFSVGDLLVRALSRLQAEAIVYGPVHDPDHAARVIVDSGIDSLVGIPVQVLGIALSRSARDIRHDRIKSVLLSADHVPQGIVRTLSDQWGCPVFQHYGMTETGYGGAVECAALAGYHPREADLFFEVIDPVNGRPLPKGETGELVVTTLTRKAMPLIRYRTGDLARFIPEPCPCGTVLERMDRVSGRLEDRITIREGFQISTAMVDNAVFSVPGVSNYQARLDRSPGDDRLSLSICRGGSSGKQLPAQVRNALLSVVPGMPAAVAQGVLKLHISIHPGVPEVSTGPQKRRIECSGAGCCRQGYAQNLRQRL
jgi:phenylacetate-CoA ligase